MTGAPPDLDGKLDGKILDSLLFDEMSGKEVKRLFRYFERRGFPENSTIFIEKMDGESLFLIADGRVELTWMVAEGSEKKLVELSPGESFGELALFDPGPRAVTARVVEDSDIYILTREKFNEMRKKDPDICLSLVIALSKKIAGSLRGSIRTLSDSIVKG
ncbi:MAG: cyclic nucleotide-binding domain-containing protein [Deltaproteobacteria bacterium]|uniref:Cyclic nucleotide-binding domain-containing protein n=1 Tax=Candidatus Zymogenus saltonus TaxID=2844893 RepID=A0A9D8KB96_9DELT|nr:cyclic nucleotide-binding domain-containing protein [Candidatus Zymogenus saltonus]